MKFKLSAIDICKMFGHKWRPCYIKGEYNGEVLKFIACSCLRCGKGRNEVSDINRAAINSEYGTYSEKYFDN